MIMMIQTDKGHFRLTFENGYTISIFNGFGSHSENHFNRNLLNISWIPMSEWIWFPVLC